MCYCLAMVFASAMPGAGAPASEPLHVRIDRLIDAPLLVSPAPPAGDAEFLRRISLDLCNRIVTADEVRAFLQNQSATKRRDLIEQSLASAQFARRLANYLDLTLMERRREKYVPQPEWENWLMQASLENRSWDRIVRELISADGADPSRRSPAKFCLEREADPNLLTRDVGRIFFGRDVQCAQCHDHPIVKDFEQREYFGLLSFFQRTELFKDAKGVYMLAEKADGNATYQSVFSSGTKHPARPALPGGPTESDVRVEPGKEYTVAPADKVRPVPTFSRREQLARTATAGSNRAFNRNIVNRLWAMMMGRGLIHPVDFDHSDNPPTHPELLDLLADEFVAMKYDMRAFLRELALTKAYQRSFDSYPDLETNAGREIDQTPALEQAVAQAEETVKARTRDWKATRRDAFSAQDAIDQAVAEIRTAEADLGGGRKAAATTAATLAESRRQSKIKTEANGAVVVALEQAKQALGKLSTDADLKLIVEKLQAKSVNLTADLQASAKAIQSQNEAAEKAAASVALAMKKVDDLAARLHIVERQGQPALAKSNAARFELQCAKAKLAVAESRLRTAKLLVDYRSKAEALRRAESLGAAARDERAAARSSREDGAVRVSVNQRRLSNSERELTALRNQMTVLGRLLVEQQTAISALPAAGEQIAKTALAVQDGELTRVAETIRQRVAALTTAATATRQKLSDQESRERALAVKCEGLRKEKPELDRALAAAEARVKQIEEQYKKPLADLDAARGAFDSVRQALMEKLAESYAVAPLKPLTAEQIHWSVLQATGILASSETAANAELDKKQPATDAQKTDSEFRKQRAASLERTVHAKLAGNLSPFVQLFGCAPGQPQFEFFATADQALFMENSDMIRAWTASGVTLIHRLTQRPEPAALAEELYLSVLNRMPTPAETTEVARWLTLRDGPSPAAISELAWAVLASVEFRFSH